jgi:hypothetical protein
VVFGIFVAAILALGVIAVRWAVRRDRLARAQQAELSEQPGAATPVDATPDQSTPSAAPTAPGSAPKRSTS